MRAGSTLAFGKVTIPTHGHDKYKRTIGAAVGVAENQAVCALDPGNRPAQFNELGSV